MNPFLERSWGDIHTRLIGYMSDELAARGLPPGLRVRAEESLAVGEFGGESRTLRADVAVMESWRQGNPPSWSPAVEGLEPVALAIPKLVSREPETHRWVEIATENGKLVTVIELLSPSNKTGVGRERYRRKRESYENAGVNVVEIDLLRGGSMTVAALAESPRDQSVASRYTICVFRAACPERYEVYHWGLLDPIPAIAIPLRPQDPDAALNLQPLVNRAYEMGYYWQDDPAGQPLDPPLSEAEHAFCLERLAAARLSKPGSAE